MTATRFDIRQCDLPECVEDRGEHWVAYDGETGQGFAIGTTEAEARQKAEEFLKGLKES